MPPQSRGPQVRLGAAPAPCRQRQAPDLWQGRGSHPQPLDGRERPVCWIEHAEPWALESELTSQLDLPLNLDQNCCYAFHDHLKKRRARARQQARALPIRA
ncbi:GIY-YIG nuclease family protein [Streptomyces sp. PAM3C]|uniref:GIY-YIG nuclease family protein n=1 Tax=Streptomyces sp. PAM3C TaxID=2847300 RepID=UPI0035ABE34D